MESQAKNIYEKLSAISTELSTVAKNLEVQVTQSSKYKAVGEADVLRAVKPLEAKHRVYSYPVDREIIDSGTLETVFNNNTKKQLYMRVKTTYRFVNMDKPAEFIDIIAYGDGLDSGDKAPGKALTYADKYALLKAYKIVTGDDPDQEASPDLVKADVKPELKEGLLKRAKALNMSLEKVATYYKKNVSALTNEDLEACIKRQEAAIAEQRAAKQGGKA